MMLPGALPVGDPTMLSSLFTKERLLIFIRHLRGLVAELEKMVKELESKNEDR